MKEKDISARELELFHETIIDYIVSLTHLYGLVHKDKVVEIFNLQNKEKIDGIVLSDIMDNPPQDLDNNFVEINGDYFVHETIMEFELISCEKSLPPLTYPGNPVFYPNFQPLL